MACSLAEEAARDTASATRQHTKRAPTSGRSAGEREEALSVSQTGFDTTICATASCRVTEPRVNGETFRRFFLSGLRAGTANGSGTGAAPAS